MNKRTRTSGAHTDTVLALANKQTARPQPLPGTVFCAPSWTHQGRSRRIAGASTMTVFSCASVHQQVFNCQSQATYDKCCSLFVLGSLSLTSGPCMSAEEEAMVVARRAKTQARRLEQVKPSHFKGIDYREMHRLICEWGPETGVTGKDKEYRIKGRRPTEHTLRKQLHRWNPRFFDYFNFCFDERKFVIPTKKARGKAQPRSFQRESSASRENKQNCQQNKTNFRKKKRKHPDSVPRSTARTKRICHQIKRQKRIRVQPPTFVGGGGNTLTCIAVICGD